jgi:putative nucleotidyltransferase with HDIG domain
MLVHVIADNPGEFSSLRVILEPRHALSYASLKEAPPKHCEAAIVAADLRKVENIEALREIFARLKSARRRIFVTDQRERLLTVQAYALGATHVFVHPINPPSLLRALADLNATEPEAKPGGAQGAAMDGAAALASMFTAVLSGRPIDVAAAKSAAKIISDNIAEDGLSNWLGVVRRHHEGTYQHCLLVTGVAVDFGLSLGLPKVDIERLHSAAMFHDIGKAKIPLTVLDKPGRLDPEERALIETHPMAGYNVLKGNSGVSQEILDAVRHHHEYLDGSGYPDGLCEEGISDIVRILTISDIFAALIEHRHYKAAMPREQAYEILRGMRGKLEGPLLTAFKDVALTR